MKANELMVGDYIWYSKANEYATKVIDIRCYGSEYAITCERAEKDPLREKAPKDSFNVQILHPIPITEELLEKNGFTVNGYAIMTIDEHTWLEYYFFEHRLRRIWKGVDEWQNHSEVRDVTYQNHCHFVHELQHALRECGVMKEFVL